MCSCIECIGDQPEPTAEDLAAERKPLTEAQIKRIGQTLGKEIPGVSNYTGWPGMGYSQDASGQHAIPNVPPVAIEFARAIEAAHGITAPLGSMNTLREAAEKVETRPGDKLGAITVGLHDDPGIVLLRRIVDSISIVNKMACWDHFAMFELRDYLCERAELAKPDARQAPSGSAQDERPYTYASTQATNCAGCGEYKHTPLRIDAMGGYVCLTCIDAKLGSLLGEFGYPAPAEPQMTEAEKDATFLGQLRAKSESWQAYSAPAPQPVGGEREAFDEAWKLRRQALGADQFGALAKDFAWAMWQARAALSSLTGA